MSTDLRGDTCHFWLPGEVKGAAARRVIDLSAFSNSSIVSKTLFPVSPNCYLFVIFFSQPPTTPPPPRSHSLSLACPYAGQENGAIRMAADARNARFKLLPSDSTRAAGFSFDCLTRCSVDPNLRLLFLLMKISYTPIFSLSSFMQ